MRTDKYPRQKVDRMLADPGYFILFFKRLSVRKNDILLLPKKRSNGDYTMRCPIHADRTPSMRLHTTRNRVKCFGCGWSGNIASLLRKVLGISFFEAIEQLYDMKMNPEGFDDDPRQLKIPFKEYGWDYLYKNIVATKNIRIDLTNDKLPF